VNQIRDAFISYAREDEDIAHQIFEDLRTNGLDVWLDSERLRPGEIWEHAIPAAIRTSTFFVALLSSQSLSKRGYFQRELNLAFEVVQELPHGSIFVIPVRIDDCEVSDPRILKYHFLDLFRSYNDALSRLVKALSLGRESSRKSDAGTRSGQSATSKDQCTKCGAAVCATESTCPVCGETLAPPNVRFAFRHRPSLQKRYREAQQNARFKGSQTVLAAFERIVAKTVVVISMSTNRLLQMLSPDQALFDSFYQLLSAPKAEQVAKEYLYPSYAQKLCFGVLSPDGVGVTEYGDVSVTLHENAIDSRASVTEVSSFDIANREFVWPDEFAGFASALSDRRLLAVARSEHAIGANTAEAELRDLILPAGERRKSLDVMEVQIYGPIDTQAIESVRIRRTARTSEGAIIQELLRRKAEQRGISLSIE
jgi:TIR domain